MSAYQISESEINKHISPALSKDYYVISYLKEHQTIYTDSQSDAKNIIAVDKRYPDDLEIWFEANDNNAGDLLNVLPYDKECFITVGTPLGLRLVQEKLKGVIDVSAIFSIVNKEKFRPIFSDSIKKLRKEDIGKLRNYPHKEADFWAGMIQDDMGSVYGYFKNDVLLGYAGIWFKDNMIRRVHVKDGYRDKGIGRKLLTKVIYDLLQRYNVVYNKICMEEMANLRMCLSVGFVPIRYTYYFIGKKEAK